MAGLPFVIRTARGPAKKIIAMTKRLLSNGGRQIADAAAGAIANGRRARTSRRADPHRHGAGGGKALVSETLRAK